MDDIEMARLVGEMQGSMKAVETHMVDTKKWQKGVDERLLKGDKTMTKIGVKIEHIEENLDCVVKAIKDPNHPCPQGQQYQQESRLEMLAAQQETMNAVGKVEKEIDGHIQGEHNPDAVTGKKVNKFISLLSNHKKGSAGVTIVGTVSFLLWLFNEMGVFKNA